jgi:putative two-component system response regulator
MHEESLSEARILIIANQDADIRSLRSIFKRAAKATVRSTIDPRKARARFEEFRPDLLILDLQIPDRDPADVMEALRPLISPNTYFPVLGFTTDGPPEAKHRALLAGVRDFLTKPFEATEVVARVKNLLGARQHFAITQDRHAGLETAPGERLREHDEGQIDLLARLAAVAEFRDDLTGQHPQRVGEHAAVLAWALGLPESEAELIRRAAPLHDIGKIAVSDRILLKPTGLTREEFEEMRTHTVVGARLLSGSRLPVLKMAEQIALTHHENWDGTGYPLRLRGQAIPLVGRIVAVADAYDAFTHDRPYRSALSPKEAWEIMWEGAGTQWDETVLEAFAAAGIGRKPDRVAILAPQPRRALATHLRR